MMIPEKLKVGTLVRLIETGARRSNRRRPIWAIVGDDVIVDTLGDPRLRVPWWEVVAIWDEETGAPRACSAPAGRPGSAARQ